MSLMRKVIALCQEWGELTTIEAYAAFHDYTREQVKHALKNAAGRGLIVMVEKRKTPGTPRSFHGVYRPMLVDDPASDDSPELLPLNRGLDPPASVWEWGQGKRYLKPVWSER